MMNRGAIAEIAAIDPAAVVVKGDLTADGRDEEYAAFLGSTATPSAIGCTPCAATTTAIEVRRTSRATTRSCCPVCACAVLDTAIPFETTGRHHRETSSRGSTTSQRRRATAPVHRHGSSPPVEPRLGQAQPRRYFGINPDDSEGLVEVIARRPSILGYFAGHTHRNRVRHFAATGACPRSRSACVKDFPGTWAEYRVFEGGVIQVHRRISTPEALAWTDEDARDVRRLLRGVRVRRAGRSMFRDGRAIMTDIRHAFNEATAGFIDAVLAVPDDAWSAPGLGVWTVRELVGHTSRAVVTVEQYLDAPKLEVTIHSPLEYYTRGLQMATPALHDEVAERGRQAGAALGDDPVGAIRPVAQRVLSRVASEPDDAVCSSRFGGMRLIDYLPTRIVELTVHTLDITDALDHPATVRGDAVAADD